MPDLTNKSILPIVSLVLILTVVAASGWLWLGIRKDPSFLSSTNPYQTPQNPLATETNINQISINDLQLRQRNAAGDVYSNDDFPNVLLIDVRTREEYAEGHIENSVNIPYADIVSGNYNLPKDSVKIVFYGNDGNVNSKEFKTSLSEKKIKQVEVSSKTYNELKNILPVTKQVNQRET